MKIRPSLAAIALGLVAALWAGAALPVRAQRTGTSVSDRQVARGEFSIENPTANPIAYDVKWGNEAWEATRLESGETATHWHKLNARGKCPAPLIRFDYLLNDGRFTEKEYSLDVKRVVKGGYGPAGNTGTPTAYFFQLYDDRELELHPR